MPHKDKERAREYWQDYHAANRKKRWTQQKARRSANPAKLAYHQHKRHAKERGIQFLLNFEEWQAIWDKSGKWEQRGKVKGQYVMARHGDTGPYATENVRITTVTDNHAERESRRRHGTSTF